MSSKTFICVEKNKNALEEHEIEAASNEAKNFF